MFDFKQSPTIKKGDSLPLGDDAKGLLVLNANNEPAEVQLDSLIKGKKVVIFGLPGV